MTTKEPKSTYYPGYPKKSKVCIDEIPCDGDLSGGCKTKPLVVRPKKD